MNVLLVDDASDVRFLLRARLSRRYPALRYSEADSGLTASIQLSQGHFDLVISDSEMSNGSGFWLYHFMRKNFPTVPLIIFTGDPRGFRASVDQTLKAIIAKGNMQGLLSEIDKWNHGNCEGLRSRLLSSSCMRWPPPEF